VTESAHPTPLRRAASLLTTALVIGHLALALAVWFLFRFLADRWWPATVLLFMPRWIYLLPLALTLPAALLFRRRQLALIAVTILILLVPVMGVRLSLPHTHPAHPAPGVLRVMTYNIGGGRPEPARLTQLLDELDPHVAMLQECTGALDQAALIARGWNVHVFHSQCLVSRYPLRKADPRDPTDVWRRGGSGAIIRYQIETPAGPIDLLNLHLETVREGLSALFDHGAAGIIELRQNIRQRAYESRLARAWAERAEAPLIIAGDFNMPIDSAIYRHYWSSFTNVFSEVGAGRGESKFTVLFGIRIDHLLVSRSGWQLLDCWVEKERHIGHDHRPVIAELRPPPHG
jgi:vancomycin resistance protein VanJ